MADDPDSSLPSGTPEQADHARVEQRAVNTGGGDYAEGDIDKRQGTFVEGNLVVTEEQSYNVAVLPNPYMGLAAFTYADRAKYAGRKQQINAALSKLTDPPRVLLFVTGASGSGKSSFVRAGVIPKLQHYYQSGIKVRIVEDMRPSRHPFDRLLDALQRQIGLPTQTINRSALPDSFYTFLANHTPLNHVNLLVIDQFEEVFTQAESAQRDALFSLLVHVPRFYAIRTHILITVRSDYLPEVFQIPTLYDHVKAGLELRAMSETELREAIQRPMQSLMQSIADPLVRQKQFERALLERLASDAASDATYLPLLQVSLEDLWQRGALKLAAYKNLSDAIRERAEQCYAQDAEEQPRPPAAQQMILQIFTALVDVSLDDNARRDVRHRQTLAELTGGEPARRRLIDELVHARLLSKGLEQRDGREVEVVDIIHESLIHNWQRLQDEIATQRSTLQRRSRFRLALKEWFDHEQSNDYLLSGVRLAEAELLHDNGFLDQDKAKEFYRQSIHQRDEEQRRALAQSQKLAQEAEARAEAEKRARKEADARASDQRKANQQIRRRSQWIALAALIALMLAGVAGWFGSVAQEREAEAESNAATAVAERDRAEEQNRIAEARRLAAEANSQLTKGATEIALLLAIEALHYADNPTTRSALQASIAARPYQVQTLQGHTDIVLSAVFSPDGRHILTASRDGTARLWDITGQPLATLAGHTNGVRSAVFSPDGQRILTASSDGTARLWDITSQPLAILEGTSAWADSALFIFSPDGQRILTASDDGTTTRLWDTTGQPLAILAGHTNGVISAVFSLDGQRILTASHDGTARLWDATGQPLATLEGHTDGVRSAVFSPDGQRILTASHDRTARLWDATGQHLAILEGHTRIVWSAAFSPDGQHILTASEDNTARLWDASGQPLAILEGHTRSVASAVFSPDGQRILTKSEDNTTRLWDATGQPLTTLAGHTDRVTSAVFSPDSQRILTASHDRTARLWEVIGQPLATLAGHTDSLRSAVFSPDGQRILTASHDRTARLWDATGQPLAILEGHMLSVNSPVFSPDGQRILTASWDKSTWLWDATGQPLATLEGHIDIVRSAVFSPDGQRILTASDDKTARLWDATGQHLAILEGHTDRVTSAVFSPDGQRILTASDDKTARLWDATGQHLAILEGHTGVVTNAVFSPDGQRILTTTFWGYTAWLWDAAGQPLATLEGHTDSLRSEVFSPDGQRILTTSDDGTARLWDATGQTLAILEDANSAVFSPDGQRILTTSDDGTARLWDATGQTLTTLVGHTNLINSAVFSANGQYILTASSDGTARLWDATGQPLATLVGHTDAVWSAVFSPDGKRILTASADGSARLWPFELADWLAAAPCNVGRTLTEDDIRTYTVPTPLFFDETASANRQCPPVYSWEQ